MVIDINNKKFKVQMNSDNGEVSSGTIFTYYQRKHIVWAKYSGGEIEQGFLVGKIVDSKCLELVYLHINTQLELMTGKCKSKVSLNESGKIMLTENWQWTCKDFSKGESIMIEI